MDNELRENRGYKSNYTYANIRNVVGTVIDSQQFKDAELQRKRNKLETEGKGKYRTKGADDRVAGLPNQKDNPEYSDDPKSYAKGYVENGGRRLEGVVYALEKEGKYDEIAAIGQRDYELGLTEEEIGITEDGKLEGLAKYPSYLEGYNSAKKMKGTR